jgi:hypothetical protein
VSASGTGRTSMAGGIFTHSRSAPVHGARVIEIIAKHAVRSVAKNAYPSVIQMSEV